MIYRETNIEDDNRTIKNINIGNKCSNIIVILHINGENVHSVVFLPSYMSSTDSTAYWMPVAQYGKCTPGVY